nr:hypothetical protein [Rhodovulum kholense]
MVVLLASDLQRCKLTGLRGGRPVHVFYDLDDLCCLIRPEKPRDPDLVDVGKGVFAEGAGIDEAVLAEAVDDQVQDGALACGQLVVGNETTKARLGGRPVEARE